MSNNYFRFKKFIIYQDKCAMKVGTDSVLLGAWANINNAKHTLDIGTGTGLLSLMIAQRSDSKIKAIEISKAAFLQAKENIHNSLWKSRIQIENISLQQFCCTNTKKYDLIICNPPFFENSIPIKNTDRANARQNISLSYTELIGCVSKLIHLEGSFCTIIPYDQENKFIKILRNNNLYCIRQTTVIPTIKKKPKRILLEIKTSISEIKKSQIIIETGKRHQYSDEYKSLTKDFYLKL